MQQNVLISAIRGVDGYAKENKSKRITSALRKVILVDGGTNGHSFLTGLDLGVEDIEEFLADIDPYPMHFVMHLIYAIEIIGYKHPSREIKYIWLKAYCTIVEALHFNPEDEDQLDCRSH